MVLLLPLVLAGPLLVLATAVVALCAHGPLGVLAAALLVVAVGTTTWVLLRLVRRWWRSTKAPERAPSPGRAPAAP